MARDAEIERRLWNWARWRASPGSSCLGYASLNWQRMTGPLNPSRDIPVPTLAGEAPETDAAVALLPGVLRRTVEIYYLAQGGMKRKAAQLCCTEAAIRLRLERADKVMAAYLAEKLASRQSERDRLTALQDSARPGGRVE